MRKTTCWTTVFALVLGSWAVAQPDNYGQFAPADAFENGVAYYGSENTWEPRQFTAERAELHYKRRGQRHIYLIMNGQAEEAANSARAFWKKNSRDVESLFALSVAKCQLGDVQGAFAAMEQAVDEGLPLERFIAGPRELLAPLTQSREFREYLAAHPVKLVHGPMLGGITATQARVWVRTADECDVTVTAFEPTGATPPRAASAATTAQNDYTAIAKLEGLSPDTCYSYHIDVDGERVSNTDFQFCTYPPTGTPRRFRVAHGGCAGYTPENERMWDTIHAFEPAALLLLGDNVYIDLPQQAGPLHRYTYYQRQSRPEFRRLVRNVPVYATWDDHDVAFDDVWLGPYRDRPLWKPSMLQLQKENWNNPAYGTADWPGCWFKFTIADVEFFVLDCRYYRTNPFSDSPTMLGPAQKQWLLDGLQRSKATFKVIASSVAWSSGAKPGSRDTWDGFATEREEIFSWLATNKIDGVFLLSADRHRSDAWRIPRAEGYPMYEFTSARLTNQETHDLMPGALFGYNERCSFGLLSFDTTQSDPQVIWEIVNIDGNTVYRTTLRKSQLSFGSSANQTPAGIPQ